MMNTFIYKEDEFGSRRAIRLDNDRVANNLPCCISACKGIYNAALSVGARGNNPGRFGQIPPDPGNCSCVDS
jgi:hypothetical protein